MQRIYPLEDYLNGNEMLKWSNDNKGNNHFATENIIWEEYDHTTPHSSETSSSLKPHLVPVSRSYTGSFVLRLFVMSAMFCKWSREGCLVPVKITQRLIGYLLLIPQIKSYLWEQRQIKGTKVIMLEIFDLLRLEVTFKGNHFTANYICHFMSQASLTRPTRTAFSESIVTNI